MERCRMVFSGSGGQGVITAAIILAEAAVLYEGLIAVQSQVYGPEARGGATRTDIVNNYMHDIGLSPLSRVMNAAGNIDLRVTGSGVDFLVLAWTAPDDDGQDGRAAAYDLRYAEQPIDEANFEDATPVPTDPPGPAGTGAGSGKQRSPDLEWTAQFSARQVR